MTSFFFSLMTIMGGRIAPTLLFRALIEKPSETGHPVSPPFIPCHLT